MELSFVEFAIMCVFGAAVFAVIGPCISFLIAGIPIHDVWTWSPERYTRRRGKIYAYFKNRSLKKSISV
ncbi:MAG: hypothetical protein WCW00_01475 [Candidatus Paceibacterota bacterium]|jgi:hypothetical protein